jgi:hypothetical protein
MVAKLKVGIEVVGLAKKLLPAPHKNKFSNTDMIKGIVVEVTKSGRGGKFKIRWLPSNIETIASARSLSLPETTTNANDNESTDSSSSDEDSQQSDSEDEPQPSETPITSPPVNLWQRVDNVTTDSFDGAQKNFRVLWPSDLPPSNMSELDVFMHMFPMEIVWEILQHTNKELLAGKLLALTKSELFKFFGLMYAMTLADFGERRNYWAKNVYSGVFEGPQFGEKFGISVKRFEDILRCLRFAPSPSSDPWSQVRAFVDAFNLSRTKTVDPSYLLCVDKRMSAYRTKKGPWLEGGMPHVTKIPRKPKGVGTEFKDCSDATTCITLQLEIQEGKVIMASKKFTSGNNAGTALVLRLAQHQSNCLWRLCLCLCGHCCCVQGERYTFHGIGKNGQSQLPKKFDIPARFQRQGRPRDFLRYFQCPQSFGSLLE